MTDHDPVNHPTHYASDAKCESCGQSIECIEVVRHLPFARGNAIKYLWRAGKKGATVEDLKKAIWYIQDEISQLEGAPNPNVHRLSKTTKTYQSGTMIWNFPENCIGADNESCLPAVDGTILHFSGCPAKPTIATQPCRFDPSQELQHNKSYAFRCDTHGYTMYMPIDKAPEQCDYRKESHAD